MKTPCSRSNLTAAAAMILISDPQRVYVVRRDSPPPPPTPSSMNVVKFFPSDSVKCGENLFRFQMTPYF